jgi:uncharacterized protein YbbC (DUF1343 family)
VYSLYGEVRRPTADMLAHFDVLLVDLQDVGCRIYTFITTLLYVLEAAARTGKTVWVLDRPNPAGRPVEGLRLRDGWESFVGAGPLPMRHGLTLGELGIWFVSHFRLALDYRVIPMRGWDPERLTALAGRGNAQLVNPPAANLSMVRVCGHGDARGNHAFEGRGTTAAGVVGYPVWIAIMLTMMSRIMPARLPAAAEAMLVRADVRNPGKLRRVPDSREDARMNTASSVPGAWSRSSVHPATARRIPAMA